MGNELFSQYSIEKMHYLTGGHLNLWKIYKGTRKTRYQKVSVFVFDKKTLDQFPKNEHEALLTILRNEAASLAKFKHPNILSIVEQLIEDKYSLGFITEDIDDSLSTWVQSKQYSLLEIKMIMSELSNTIAFLYNDCNIIHTNINPDGLFISNDLHVKLSSLHFTLKSGNDQDMTCFNSSKSFLNRNLSFVAPEIVYSSKGSSNSDIFSLGLILCFLLKSLNRESNNASLLDLRNNIPDDYKRAISTIDNRLNALSYITVNDKKLITAMLKKESKQRLVIDEVLKQEFFNDNYFKALLFIQNITTNDIKQNTEFFKQYPIILPLFDNRIISQFFLPSLLNNLQIDNLTNILLPNVFATCEYHPTINFEETVWPKLKNLFQMKTIPAPSLYYLLLKMVYIGEKISAEEFSTHCVSIICKAMDCGVVKIQIAVADSLPFVAVKIEENKFINQIYPRILQILANTPSNELKGKLLEAIWKVVPNALAQSIVNDSLFSFLELLCKKNSGHSICVGVVKIYEGIEKIVSIDDIVKKIVPNLIAILSNGLLSSLLFERIMDLIQRLLLRIKNSREKELIKEPMTQEENNKGDKEKERSGLRNMSNEKRMSILTELFRNQNGCNTNIDTDEFKQKDNDEFDEDNNKDDENKDKDSNHYLKPKPLSIKTSETVIAQNIANKETEKKTKQIPQASSLDSNKINNNDIFNTILKKEDSKNTSNKIITSKSKNSNFNQWDEEEDEENEIHDVNNEDKKEKESKMKSIHMNVKTPIPKQAQIKEPIKTGKAQTDFINNLDSLLND